MPLSTRRAPMRMAGFVAMAMAAILIEVAPLGLSAGASSAPDLVAVAVFFWALRRPEATPILLVFLVAILRDLLAGGPVGAGALTLVIAAVMVRARNGAHLPPHLEWALFAIFAFATAFGAWLMVWITAGGAPALSTVLSRAALSVMVYPAIYVIFQGVFRVRSREMAERRAAGGFW